MKYAKSRFGREVWIQLKIEESRVNIQRVSIQHAWKGSFYSGKEIQECVEWLHWIHLIIQHASKRLWDIWLTPTRVICSVELYWSSHLMIANYSLSMAKYFYSCKIFLSPWMFFKPPIHVLSQPTYLVLS